uniref:YTH domain-containing protein n=1 Tax=Angiostrongylus cantonensis TaxID=6313 RepID=A0A158PAJ7_ANGCA
MLSCYASASCNELVSVTVEIRNPLEKDRWQDRALSIDFDSFRCAHDDNQSHAISGHRYCKVVEGAVNIHPRRQSVVKDRSSKIRDDVDVVDDNSHRLLSVEDGRQSFHSLLLIPSRVQSVSSNSCAVPISSNSRELLAIWILRKKGTFSSDDFDFGSALQFSFVLKDDLSRLLLENRKLRKTILSHSGLIWWPEHTYAPACSQSFTRTTTRRTKSLIRNGDKELMKSVDGNIFSGILRTKDNTYAMISVMQMMNNGPNNSGFNLNPGAGRNLPAGAFWPQQPPQPTSDAQSERSNSEASPPVVPTSTAVNHMTHSYATGYPEWQAAQKAFAAAQSVNGAGASAKFPPGPSGFDMMSAAVNPMCPPEFYHPGITWPGYQYGQQYPFATAPYAQHMMDIPGLTEEKANTLAILYRFPVSRDDRRSPHLVGLRPFVKAHSKASFTSGTFMV